MTQNFSNWRPHKDVRLKAARSNQKWMAESLIKLGRADLVTRNSNRLRLPPEFCQYKATARRRRWERQACHVGQAGAGEFVVMVNLVVPWSVTDRRPFRPAQVGAIRQFVLHGLSGQTRIRRFVGMIEADFARYGPHAEWIHGVHGIAVVQAASFKHASKIIHSALAIPSDESVYRPLVVRQVYDLPGAARYVMKSVHPRSICERSAWMGKTATGNARRMSRKLSLKKPQLVQLIKSLSRESLFERAIWKAPSTDC